MYDVKQILHNLKGILSRKMFGFNITSGAIACIVRHSIMLGAGRTLNLKSFLPKKSINMNKNLKNSIQKRVYLIV